MINSTQLTARFRPVLNALFILLTLAMIGLLSYQIPRGIGLETNLQALFPQDKDDKVAEKVNEDITREFGNKLLIAVQAPSLDEVKIAADILANVIAQNPKIHIANVNSNVEQMEQQRTLLQQYRYSLLTTAQANALQQKQFANLLSQAQAALFGFNPNAAALSPLEDPLNLNSSYLQQLQPALNGELVNDHLLLADDKGQLILFAINLEGDAFNVDLQENISNWLENLHTHIKQNPETKNTQVLVSGLVFHAADASSRAKAEMNFISVGDILASILLFIFTFYRIRPLVLTLTSIAYGFGLALAFNLLWFGKIHIMTLVFGTSLIGVAIDYSVHYLCKHQELFTHTSNKKTSHYIIQKLLPALTLGLLASLVGYACLLQPSLPGLKQIASFSIVGLSGSWLFVVVVYPFLVNKPLPKPHAFIDACSFAVWRFWAALTSRVKWSLLSGLFLIMAIGMLQFHFSSDIRTLYKPSADLLYSEQRLQQVLQGVSPNQYYLLHAADEESLLQAEEQLRREHLDPLVAKGALKAYSATSLIVPSQKQQHVHYQLMQEQLFNSEGLAKQFMLSAGFDEQAFTQAQQLFSKSANKTLSLNEWLAVARPDQRLLWLGKVDKDYVSIIGLRGVSDVASLEAIANKQSIRWVNRVADMSGMLQHLTQSAAAMLGLAYCTTLIILWFAYRRPQALLLISVPLMTTLLTLGLLSLAGVPITLFHIFGCYLILGLGMDYSIFSYAEGVKDIISQRSIWFSAMTSGISFGLLGFSSTPMVKAFGITLLLGCFFNLIFAPLVGNLNPKNRVTA